MRRPGPGIALMRHIQVASCRRRCGRPVWLSTHEPFGPEPRLGARDLLAEPVDLGVPAVTRACPLRTDDGGEDPRRPYPRHRDHHQNRLALGPGGAPRPATAARRRRYPTTNASTYRPCSAGTSHPPALDRGSRGRRDRRARARVLAVSAAARPGRRLPFGPRSPIADIGDGRNTQAYRVSRWTMSLMASFSTVGTSPLAVHNSTYAHASASRSAVNFVFGLGHAILSYWQYGTNCGGWRSC